MNRCRAAFSFYLLFVMLLSGCPGYEGTSLLPGPLEAGYDGELERKADCYDRQHLIFNCAGNGINGDVGVALDQPAERRLIEDFLRTTDAWSFSSWSGRDALDVITDTQKVAGLYAGVGIAADAYRYGTLRDQGYPQADVARAREFLRRGIEGLRVAVEITGVPGVIARGFCRTDIPSDGAGQETTPLFDDHGNPLPPEKSNGTWREDNSGDGRFPNMIWEDSCSRDQFLGWAAAFAAVWEVIRDDTTFPAEVKTRLQAHAGRLGHSLMVKRTGGPGSMGRAYDLEIFDADGRTAFHGYIHEQAWDRVYLPWLPFRDGMYAMMSLGIVGALTYCSEDPLLEEYLYGHLIGERELDRIAGNHQLGVNLGLQTNYSAVNMALQAALLAQRYLRDPAARIRVRRATLNHLYRVRPDVLERQPEAYAYSLFDFAYAVSVSRASAFGPMTQAPDFQAVARGIGTLHDFREPPYWEEEVINCDSGEISSGHCVLLDGSEVQVLGEVGRKGDLITEEPIPHAVRPPSNYHWRSNPYKPNGGGDGTRMLPGVDFRYAYWYGRFVR